MGTSLLTLRLLGALGVTLGLVGLGVLLRTRAVRAAALVATVALTVSVAVFGVAWARQLAQGRQPTEGPGYFVMWLMTPMVAGGVLLSLLPLVTHLALWRALPPPSPPRNPVMLWTLVGVTAFSALAMAAPGLFASPPRAPVVALGYSREGPLAGLEDGTVLGWSVGRPAVQSEWSLGEAVTGELHFSADGRWVARVRAREVTLFALPAGGGKAKELLRHQGRAWGFAGPGLFAVSEGMDVVVHDVDEGTSRRVTWRSEVTALTQGDAQTVVVADAESNVTWVELQSGTPGRTGHVEKVVTSLQPLVGGTRVLAQSAAGTTDVMGGDPLTLTPLPQRLDAAAPMANGMVVWAMGPEGQRYEVMTNQRRPFFNHGLKVTALAGHPSEPRAVVALEHELWSVSLDERGRLVEEKLLAW